MAADGRQVGIVGLGKKSLNADAGETQNRSERTIRREIKDEPG